MIDKPVHRKPPRPHSTERRAVVANCRFPGWRTQRFIVAGVVALIALMAIRASEAVALFCYQAKKWIAALGGLDTLVFAGGIGENAPIVRARICEGLGLLGVSLSESHNAESAGVISTDDSPATVRIIRTDEDLMIARSVRGILETDAGNGKDRP
jgi:hypothetical protein